MQLVGGSARLESALCLPHVCVRDVLGADPQTSGAACVRRGVRGALRACRRGAGHRVGQMVCGQIEMRRYR